MNESFEFLYKNFNIIAESAAIIFLGIVLYLLTKKFISKLFDKFKEKIDTRKYKTFQIACNSIIKYIIFFVIICMFFNVLGIDMKSILTVAGIGSITVGLAAQSLIKDFITGIFILFENQYNMSQPRLWFARPWGIFMLIICFIPTLHHIIDVSTVLKYIVLQGL